MKTRMIQSIIIAAIVVLIVLIGFRVLVGSEEGYTRYSYNLIYMQGCSIGNIREEQPENFDTLQEQIDYCNEQNNSQSAGFYVYDFSTEQSIFVGKSVAAFLEDNNGVTLPTSLYGDVNGKAPNFYLPDKFKRFGISCKDQLEVYECIVDEKDGTRIHPITKDLRQDLFIVKGFIRSPRAESADI